MCSGSKRQVTSSGVFMEGDSNTHKQEEEFLQNSSILLELSAVDDLVSFESVVQEKGYDVDESSFWYGRRTGSKKLGFEERTPLMIAAMFGSKDVLKYILQTGSVDVNRSCGSDGATALHCAAISGSCQSHEIVKLLVDASADINRVDANGSRPCDVIALCPSGSSLSRKILEITLKGEAFDQVIDKLSNESNRTEKKEYPIDPSLPDIKNGICSTDEFRMYTFKVQPCSRAYSHDWTVCPFVHPGENARRRDPRKFHYSCVPCPEFRKGNCVKGDVCEYSHGIFESWLHPAQYRTRLCKDETNCTRRVCFFAHKLDELRPVPSPRSMAMTPPPFQLPGSRLRTCFNARNVGMGFDYIELENQRCLLYDVFGNVESVNGMQIHPNIIINQHLGFAKRNGQMVPCQLSNWGSPGGELDWGIQGEELNKLRKSASLGFRNNNNVACGEITVDLEQLSFDEKLKLNSGGSEMMIPSWADQLYMEQEQMVA